MPGVPGGDLPIHPSTWGNPRAERALGRLRHVQVPEVSARTMRRRLRDVPAALPPQPDGPDEPAPRRRRAERAPLRGFRGFLSIAGRVSTSLGVLCFAFAAYQLWGTGIQYARAQADLEDQFAEQLAAFSTVADPPGVVSTLPQITDPVDTTTGAVPASADPATTAPATTASDAAAAPPGDSLELALGDLLGRIEIPAIGVDDYIVAGVRAKDLASGVGHYPYTPLPGSTGNSAIAGHRTTHGQPFFELDQLVAGDEIVVTTVQGRFVYTVTGSKVVEPTDFSVLFGSPDESVLTLTTCHPRYSQKKRLVVSAVLAEDRSTGGGATIEYTPDAVEEAEAAVELPAEAADPDDPTSVPAAQTIDAFSSGWFSDPAAWPHIAAWGVALSACALLATWFGRRTRNWISAPLFLAPFVVLLYFWFENVNRLLPPGL